MRAVSKIFNDARMDRLQINRYIKGKEQLLWTYPGKPGSRIPEKFRQTSLLVTLREESFGHSK